MAQNPVPPIVRSQLQVSQLPLELRTLVSRLEQRYGPALRVTSSDREWLEFHVEGIPLDRLHADLQVSKAVLTAGFAERIQLIHPLRPGQSGLYFHLLTAPSFADRASLAAFGG
jgi:hypothetical protein